MPPRQKTRFGIIGAGAIAQAYSQAFASSQSAELAAVCDVRRETADALAGSQPGCQSFCDHEQMLGAMALDAIVVCTPPVTHPELCITAMERGHHVLCEKPLAIDATSAREMLSVADRTGVQFTMASKFRHVEDVTKAKAIVTSGILGEIILFENTFAGQVDMTSRWNSDPLISGGGVLIDNGTHSVDIIRYFLGPLAEVQAVEGKRIQDLPVEDTVRMFARTHSGVMASIDLSWSLNKQSPYYISIYGAYGTVLVGWKESVYRRNSDQDWIVFGNGYNKAKAFQNQIDNFSAAIRGDETLIISPQDALASVNVVEVAYDALWRDTWVRVDQAPSPMDSSSTGAIPSATPAK